MSFDTLKDAILNEARREAEQISDMLTAQAKAEEDRITGKARVIEEDIIRQAEAEADRQAKLKRQEVELSGRAAVLSSKEAELAETKRQFIAHMLEQDEAATTSLLEGLLASLPQESGTIVPGEKHREQLKKLASQHPVAAESIPNEGGFIFRSQNMEFNLTLGYLANQLFTKHRSELAKMLFS